MTDAHDHEAQQKTHEQIIRKIDRVREDLRSHIDETHASLMHRSEIEAADGNIVGKIDTLQKGQAELARVVLGEPRITFDGQMERSGGMKEIVDNYQNGGFRVHLPVWSKIAGFVLTLMNILFMLILIVERIGATP